MGHEFIGEGEGEKVVGLNSATALVSSSSSSDFQLVPLRAESSFLVSI